MTTKIGYVRLSRDDGKSMSIENQKKALLAYDPTMKIFVDRGVSGETNLTDPASEWSQKVRPLFRQNPANTQIVVYTFDRIGRKRWAVLKEVDEITKSEGSIHVVRDSRTYTDGDEASQAAELTFRSLVDEAYRTEGKKKTQRAIDVLKDAKVPLGRKPSLTEKQIKEIKALHKLGLGLTAIGKAVRTHQKSDDSYPPTAPRTIKKVLDGNYESREAYEKRALQRREEMKARALLGGGDDA